MNSFGEYLLIITLLFSASVHGIILTPKLPDQGAVTRQNNSFMDPKSDYSRFMGRVTDKDDSGNILKVKVENNNSKFLKAGDFIYFKVNNQEKGKFCKASVRSVEDFYFSMYVRDFEACWDTSKYFPRGMQLNFKTKKLAQRVFEASKYRELLILRKESFLGQLNDINHFLWTFDQQRLKSAAQYDEEINALLREKRLALDNLMHKKQESILLQTELIKKLDSVDESLNHYKVERQEYLTDRWHMDHEQDLPVIRRPQKMKRP
jgi:hypothetical protein